MLIKKFREQLKKDIVDSLEPRFVKIEQALGQTDGKVDGLGNRLGGLEKRFDGLEDRFDGLEDRFDGLEDRFDGLENKFETLRTEVIREIRVGYEQMDRNFKAALLPSEMVSEHQVTLKDHSNRIETLETDVTVLNNVIKLELDK